MSRFASGGHGRRHVLTVWRVITVPIACLLQVSVLEIYNNNIVDLLSPPDTSADVKYPLYAHLGLVLD